MQALAPAPPSSGVCLSNQKGKITHNKDFKIISNFKQFSEEMPIPDGLVYQFGQIIKPYNWTSESHALHVTETIEKLHQGDIMVVDIMVVYVDERATHIDVGFNQGGHRRNRDTHAPRTHLEVSKCRGIYLHPRVKVVVVRVSFISPVDINAQRLTHHVLCHILSFLPTKTSVKTSILSTRWSSIWAHVPTLDFHHDDYRTGTTDLPNIVSRVMSLHKVQTLDSLRLIFQDCSDFELETLIIIAMSRNVRNLDIEVDSESTLPRRLFTFRNLVRLRLSGFPCIYKTRGDVHLPCLKRLHLDYLQCQVDEDLPRLLSGCPVLEDLTLEIVSFAEKKSGCFNVSSSSLKRLVVIMGDNIY
ncbi:putative fbd-associated F-box protein at5g56700, partial [Phtheirospermum japonicum]